MAIREPLKVGLIGCGHVAEHMHLPAMARLAGIRIVALSDIDPAQLERVADRFDVRQRYTDYAQLVNDPTVEAVGVCVPPSLHLEVASAVLAAKKHLLLEKPLALSLDDCDLLIERARDSGCVTMLGFNLRWHRLVRRTAEILRQGRLGTIKSIHSVLAVGATYGSSALAWRKRRSFGGGALADMAVHHFDLWRFLLRAEVQEVSASSASGENEDEQVSVVARMADGTIACSSFVKNTGTAHEVMIFGSSGLLALSCLRFDGLRWFPCSSRPGRLSARLGNLVNTMKELPRLAWRRGSRGEYSASFQHQWRHFAECVRTGATPQCRFADGRSATQTVLAAAHSASTGRAVKTAEAPHTLAPVSEGASS